MYTNGIDIGLERHYIWSNKLNQGIYNNTWKLLSTLNWWCLLKEAIKYQLWPYIAINGMQFKWVQAKKYPPFWFPTLLVVPFQLPCNKPNVRYCIKYHLYTMFSASKLWPQQQEKGEEGLGRIKHMNSNLDIELEEYIRTYKNARTINDEIYSRFNSILSQWQ